MKNLNLNELQSIFGGVSDTTCYISAALSGAIVMYYYPPPTVYIDPHSSSKDVRLYFYHHTPKAKKYT